MKQLMNVSCACGEESAYSVSRKNVLPWLAAALMFCSAVIRIIYFCTSAEISGKIMLLQIIVPILANIWFAGSVLCSGPERLYRSAIPVLLVLLCCAVGAETGSAWVYLLYWMLYLAAATVYFSTVSGGAGSKLWLIPLFGTLLLLQSVALRTEFRAFERMSQTFLVTSQLMMTSALFLVICAMHKRPVEAREHRTWGDRSDGRLVRTLSPMSKVSPYIMVNRTAASNQFTEKVEITALDRYVHEKRRQGMPDFGILHGILAAYVRTVAAYPAINRFCSGQKVYARDRKIEIVMAIKKEMSTEAPDTMISVYLDPGDTAEDVYRKFNEVVASVKESDELDSGFDNLAAAINAIPGVALKFAIWFLKTLDYFGLLPGWLLRLSPFHGSMIITSMGSLGIPPIFHHLYDFGNLPIFVAFGHKYRENEVRLDGTVIPHKYVDFCYVCDERICDGFYYATALRYLRQMLLHPEQLDTPPAEIRQDID